MQTASERIREARETAVLYEWRVVLLQTRQGFQKSYAVLASNYLAALDQAVMLLEGAGYWPEGFEAIEVKRGTSV